MINAQQITSDTKTTRAVRKDETVYATKDYSMFKQFIGNRGLNKSHLVKLAKSILSDNLLAQNPIIVNENMEVIDGQHRLEIAKNNGLIVYYTIVPGARLEAIQRLNVNMRLWSYTDFLLSYVAQGKKDYAILQDFIEEHGIPLLISRMFLSGDRRGLSEEFKNGNFKVSNLDRARMYAEAYKIVRPYVAVGAYNDREFIVAFMKALDSGFVTGELLVERCTVSNKSIEPERDPKGYLRQMEDILNWRKQTVTRLY